MRARPSPIRRLTSRLAAQASPGMREQYEYGFRSHGDGFRIGVKLIVCANVASLMLVSRGWSGGARPR